MSEKEQRRDWKSYRFDEIAINVNDRVEPSETNLQHYVGLEHLDSESLKIRRWGTPDDVDATKLLFRTGDIIFGRRRVYQRKLAVAEFNGICSAHAMVLRPRPEVVLPEFLPFFMQSDLFMNRAMEISVGSLSPTINWKTLARKEFALPPLAEQRRIAEVLGATEQLSNDILHAINTCSTVMGGHLVAFLEQFDSERFVYQVGEILRESPKNGYSPRTNDSGSGLRTVSISSISDGKFVTDGNVKYADVELAKVSSFFVCRDDVFVVRGNGNRYIAGKCGIAEESYDDLFYPDLLIRLRFKENIMLPRFAALQWNSPLIHRDLISRAKSTNGIWKVNGQDIRNHRLIVPPLDQQVSFLSDHTNLQEALEALISRRQRVTEIQRRIQNNAASID